MIAHSNLQPIGRMAVFFVPAQKLAVKPDTQNRLEEKLLSTYQGYTKMTQHIEGHYCMGHEVVKDEHIRYEVSFPGKKQIPAFVALISRLARDLGEEAIYLTMGQHSYLVTPS